MEKKVPIEVSARHIHLSQKDLEALFGKGYQLEKLKDLTQPSDFAAKETVDVFVGKKKIEKLRIVGPVREKTQVELAKTDALHLASEAPIRISGDLKGTPGAVLKGSEGEVEIKEGLIIAQRHIHASPEEADSLGLKEGDLVSVKVEGERSLAFHKVKVRVREDYRLCMHIDTDEGNAASVDKKGEGIIL